MFDSNLLTTDPADWVLTNASFSGVEIVLAAEGSAVMPITTANMTIIPDRLEVLISSSRYADPSSPDLFAQLAILYLDGTFVKYDVPIVDNNSGNCRAVLMLESQISQAVSFKLRGSNATIQTYSASIESDSNVGLQEDQVYYGVKIGETYGLNIAREDGLSEVTLNSDIMEFIADNEKILYFDVLKKNFVYNGLFSAAAVRALSLSADKGNIAELTVDQLDTSDKVKNYLNSITDDVNYIRIYDQNIELITAKTDGTQTEQLTNRDLRPLYWTDDQNTAITYNDTGLPVLIYVYDEAVKVKLAFEESENNEPLITLGAGSDPSGLTDNGKAFIYKDTSGFTLEYHLNSGGTIAFKIDDSGIYQVGGIGDKGLRNIAIGNIEPTEPQNNDLWIDTDA